MAESEMVERVADACQAILKRRGMNSRPHAEELARAAIEAMRTPTGKMLDMGQHFYDKTDCGLMGGSQDPLLEAWDTMISIALEP